MSGDEEVRIEELLADGTVVPIRTSSPEKSVPVKTLDLLKPTPWRPPRPLLLEWRPSPLLLEWRPSPPLLAMLDIEAASAASALDQEPASRTPPCHNAPMPMGRRTPTKRGFDEGTPSVSTKRGVDDVDDVDDTRAVSTAPRGKRMRLGGASAPEGLALPGLDDFKLEQPACRAKRRLDDADLENVSSNFGALGLRSTRKAVRTAS